jgi:hypothetical protein
VCGGQCNIRIVGWEHCNIFFQSTHHLKLTYSYSTNHSNYFIIDLHAKLTYENSKSKRLTWLRHKSNLNNLKMVQMNVIKKTILIFWDLYFKEGMISDILIRFLSLKKLYPPRGFVWWMQRLGAHFYDAIPFFLDPCYLNFS